MKRLKDSPIGKTTRAGSLSRAARSDAYAKERARVVEFGEIAKLVIQRRTELGVSQASLAKRAKTSYSAISRLETGRHATNVRTLRAIFSALESQLVLGYRPTVAVPGAPATRLVAV